MKGVTASTHRQAKRKSAWKECCANVKHIKTWTDQHDYGNIDINLLLLTKTNELNQSKLELKTLTEVFVNKEAQWLIKSENLQTDTNSKYTALQIHCGDIESQLKHKQTDLEKVELLLQATKNELLNAHESWNCSTNDCWRLELLVETLTAQLSQQETQTEANQQDLQSAMESCTNLKSQIGELQHRHTERESLLVLLKDQIIQAKLQMDSWQTKYEALQLHSHKLDLERQSCEFEKGELKKSTAELQKSEKTLIWHVEDLTLNITSLTAKYNKLFKFGVHVFGDKLQDFVDQDTIYHAGQVGELSTLYMIQKLYPGVEIERIGHLNDCCDLKCTFDSDIDPKVVLVECKGSQMESRLSSLNSGGIEKFIDNVKNNTKYDGGLLVRAPQINMTKSKITTNGKHSWLSDCYRFTDHANLFSCIREEVDMKRAIDTMLIEIRATENRKLGEKSSQLAIDMYRDFIGAATDELNPILQGYYSNGKKMNLLYNTMSTFSVNQGITILPLPPIKKLLL